MTIYPVYSATFLADHVVIRVSGRATMLNAEVFKNFIQHELENGNRKFIIDLGSCESLDSTFAGVLVGLTNDVHKPQLLIAMCNEKHRRIFTTLGIASYLQFLKNDIQIPPKFSFTPLQEPSRAYGQNDRIQMIVDAHKNLIRANTVNEALFGEFIRQATQELQRIV